MVAWMASLAYLPRLFIYHIENIVKPVSKAGHADKVIFLTADAFGVLPGVSILSDGQSIYHFLSGFTS